jgi:predicted AAA+ superfamily ATPase
MRWVPRAIEGEVRRAARGFPALIVTGPRRSGKTSLLRRMFPGASWVLLEDPDIIARVRADPRGFLDGLRLPAILDEVQNVPEILSYVRTRSRTRRRSWHTCGRGSTSSRGAWADGS